MYLLRGGRLADGEIWIYIVFFIAAMAYSYLKFDRNKKQSKRK